MKTSTMIVAAVTAASAALAVATPALAQQDEPDPARVEFVCANLDQMTQLQADRAALIEDRVALLTEARAAAEANGNTEAMERIDRRIARSTERAGKVAERQQQLTDFAAANC